MSPVKDNTYVSGIEIAFIMPVSIIKLISTEKNVINPPIDNKTITEFFIASPKSVPKELSVFLKSSLLKRSRLFLIQSFLDFLFVTLFACLFWCVYVGDLIFLLE